MDCKDELIKIGKKMKDKSVIYHKKLTHAPSGSILIIQDGGYTKIYQVYSEDGKPVRKGIKRNNTLIRGLVRKAYLQETVKRLDRNIIILRDAVKKMDNMGYESILQCMPKNYNLLDDKYKTDWVPADMHPVFTDTVPITAYSLYVSEGLIDSWGSIPYRANTIQLQGIKHRTETGVYMRSKSEISIFDIYKRLGIPVHYDEIMSFNGTIKSPDFISMRYDGKLIFHEHCGKVNDPSYMEAHYKKMELYRNCGIVPWDNLIVTYENAEGGIDLQLAEAEIISKHRL